MMVLDMVRSDFFTIAVTKSDFLRLNEKANWIIKLI